MRVTVLLWSTRRFSQRSVGFTNRRPSTLENSNVFTTMESWLRKGRRYLNVRGSADFSLGQRSEVAMVLWIGVDDTDSLRGMCTTFLAAELVHDLTEDRDLIGYPRLVRLNPTIPWKTRGNGAICLRFGRGVGPRILIGDLEGRPSGPSSGHRVTRIPSGCMPASRTTSRAGLSSENPPPTLDSASFRSSQGPPCTGKLSGGLSQRKRRWPRFDHPGSSESTRTVEESSAHWPRPRGGLMTEPTKCSVTATSPIGERSESWNRDR